MRLFWVNWTFGRSKDGKLIIPLIITILLYSYHNYISLNITVLLRHNYIGAFSQALKEFPDRIR